jgi:tRNA(Ile)-lysidine synthetase-like protein
VDLLGLEQELVVRLPGAEVQFPWYPQLRQAELHSLDVPGGLGLAQGWELQAERIEISPVQRPRLMARDQRREVAVDAAALKGGLAVRPPQPGDRIRPLGMEGSVKLADLFWQRSVPWPARSRWPVVVDGSAVVWVAGLHLSRLHRLTPESQQAIGLRLAVRHREHAPEDSAS